MQLRSRRLLPAITYSLTSTSLVDEDYIARRQVSSYVSLMQFFAPLWYALDSCRIRGQPLDDPFPSSTAQWFFSDYPTCTFHGDHVYWLRLLWYAHVPSILRSVNADKFSYRNTINSS